MYLDILNKDTQDKLLHYIVNMKQTSYRTRHFDQCMLRSIQNVISRAQPDAKFCIAEGLQQDLNIDIEQYFKDTLGVPIMFSEFYKYTQLTDVYIEEGITSTYFKFEKNDLDHVVNFYLPSSIHMIVIQALECRINIFYHKQQKDIIDRCCGVYLPQHEYVQFIEY